MHSHVGAVAAATGVVEAITAASPAAGRFAAVVTALPVADMQLRDAAMAAR
jgi:hypothetical protein